MKFFEKLVMFCLITEAAIPAVRPVVAPDSRVFVTPETCEPSERKYSLMCWDTCCVVVRVGRTSMNRKRAIFSSGCSIAASIIFPTQNFLLKTAGGSASMSRKISTPFSTTASPPIVLMGILLAQGDSPEYVPSHPRPCGEMIHAYG